MDPKPVLQRIRDAKLRINLLGESLTDVWILGYAGRPAQEKPSLNRFLTERVLEMEGGAANVRVSLAAILRTTVHHTTSHLSSKKIRYWNTRTDNLVFRHDQDAASTPFEDIADVSEPLVITDYGKGWLDWPTIHRIAEKHKQVIFSPHLVNCLRFQRHHDHSILNDWLWVMNAEEYLALTGFSPRTPGKFPWRAVVTCGPAEIVIHSTDAGFGFYRPREIIPKHTVGIGDVFMGGLVSAWFTGSSLMDSVDFAAEIASRVLEARRDGTCRVTEEDLK